MAKETYTFENFDHDNIDEEKLRKEYKKYRVFNLILVIIAAIALIIPGNAKYFIWFGLLAAWLFIRLTKQTSKY